MLSETVYLTIPKETAARKITAAVSELKTTSDSGDKIVIGKDAYRGGSHTRVILEDYEFRNEKIETPDGTLETGVLGAKMEYDKKSSHTYGREARDAVSKYIETG
jgi:hypothetical protein